MLPFFSPLATNMPMATDFLPPTKQIWRELSAVLLDVF